MWNKFIVAILGALVSAALQAIRNRYNIDLMGMEPDLIAAVTGGVTAALVWAVPNKRAEG